MDFRLFDHNQRLIVRSVTDKHRLIETQPNLAMAARAPKQVAADRSIGLSRNLLMTERAGGDVAKVAVGTNCGEDRANNVATVLTRLANHITHFTHLNVTNMSVFAQNAINLVSVAGREFKIGTLLFIAMRAIQWIVRVNLQGGVSPQVTSNTGGDSQVFCPIPRRLYGDSESHGLLPLLNVECFRANQLSNGLKLKLKSESETHILFNPDLFHDLEAAHTSQSERRDDHSSCPLCS
jgi:hypothetical protein